MRAIGMGYIRRFTVGGGAKPKLKTRDWFLWQDRVYLLV
ncbi:hypothetical protein FRUB_07887 [Fimbriiglobus ruber]|uniref:Uncharacterized protein n=1 Tax=Fimbriiglobus ruber TaxID=1908690 RepID=A0A225DKN5_9BACT|nr:hypothetical protein FRUB_07887 [Fimbriiglobus ruber]